MSSFIQLIKLLISGKDLKGIRFRTDLSIILTCAVLLIEIVVFYVCWDSIPDIIKYDYDFSGVPNSICEKQWIWANIALQIFICAFVFIIKYFSYKIKHVHNIVYDENNNIIPIIDKRFSMFAWETAMLFVTTEQCYIFALLDIIEDRMCDALVTIVFLFWQIVLIIEFLADIKALKSLKTNSKNFDKAETKA